MSRLTYIIRASFLGVGLLLSACATVDPEVSTQGVSDPREAENRQMHAFNKDVDRVLFSPVADGYGVLQYSPRQSRFEPVEYSYPAKCPDSE